MFYGHLPPRLRIALWGLLIVAMAATVATSLIYSNFAAAFGDDYCRAAGPTDPGAWWSQVKFNYYHWTGRWLAIAIYAVSLPFIDINSHTYGAIVLLSGIIWFAVFLAVVQIILQNSISFSEKLLFSLILCVVYFSGAPRVGESWYWITGLVEYELPVLLMAVSLLVLTSRWILDGGLAKRLSAFLAGAILAILATGLSELISLYLLGVLALACVIAFLRRRPALGLAYVAVGVVVGLGLAFNLTAPGNAFRAAESFTNARDLPYAIRLSLLESEQSPLQWLADARLIWLTLILLTSPWFLARSHPAWADWKLPRPLGRWAYAAPLIGLAAVMLGHFIVVYGQGSAAPGRVLNLLYAVFIIGWLAAVSAVAPQAAGGAGAPNSFLRGVNIAAAVLLPLSLVVSQNVSGAIAELGVASTWRSALSARVETIESRVAAGEKDILLEPITSKPRMFYWDELSADPKSWWNECMALDFKARTLRTAEH